MAFPSDLAMVRCPVSSGRVAASWWSARADGTKVHSVGLGGCKGHDGDTEVKVGQCRVMWESADIGDPLLAGRIHMTSCIFRCDRPGSVARCVGSSQGGNQWARVSASVVIITSTVSVMAPRPQGLLGSYLTCRCAHCVW